jgi:hypothetical protein
VDELYQLCRRRIIQAKRITSGYMLAVLTTAVCSVTRTQPSLPVKFPSLDTDTILSNSHAQVFHGEHRPTLPRATGATTAKTRTLNAQMCVRFAFACVAATNARCAACCASSSTAGHVQT